MIFCQNLCLIRFMAYWFVYRGLYFSNFKKWSILKLLTTQGVLTIWLIIDIIVKWTPTRWELRSIFSAIFRPIRVLETSPRTNVFPLVAGSCVACYRSVARGTQSLLATSHQGFSYQLAFHQAEWLLGASNFRWFLPAGAWWVGLVAGSYSLRKEAALNWIWRNKP